MIDGSHTVDKLNEYILRFEDRTGIEVTTVMIDYLQKLKGKGTMFEKVTSLSDGLGMLRDSIGCAIISAVQPHRLDGKEISMSAGAGSSEIENNMDFIFGLTREGQNVKVKVLKTREGIERDVTVILYHKYPSRIMAPLDKHHVFIEDNVPF